MLGKHGGRSQHLLGVLNHGHNLRHGVVQVLVLAAPTLGLLLEAVVLRGLQRPLFAGLRGLLGHGGRDHVGRGFAREIRVPNRRTWK